MHYYQSSSHPSPALGEGTLIEEDWEKEFIFFAALPDTATWILRYRD